MLKKALRIVGKTVIGIVAFVVLYFAMAWLLSRIHTAKEKGAPEEVVIYIKTNGVHTDIVMPVQHPLRNWGQKLPYSNTRDKDTAAAFVGIGWGDRGFYLETPTWADLKFSTAFKAAFALSTTAMHITYYKSLGEGADCKKIRISHEQYGRLIRYVDDRFKTDSAGHTIVIPTDAVYSGADAFYEAKGSYNLFRTCNTWTNNALKSCGQRAAIWAPFDWGIFYQYRD